MARLSGVLLLIALAGIFYTGPSIGQGVYIPNVPDADQPPTQTIPSTVDSTNYCAPMAAVNITEYWDSVMTHPNAVGVNAALPIKTAAEYLGYFMCTNGSGDSTRMNWSMQWPGTMTIDQQPGLADFVRWDAANMFNTPLPNLPSGKMGYNWRYGYLDILMTGSNDSVGFDFSAGQIDSGCPVKIDFTYWNLDTLNVATFVDTTSGDTIYFYDWGDTVSGSTDSLHEEDWNEIPGPEGIGHAVTGVGYFRNFDPDTIGPLPRDDYIVVHDNWYDTPMNVAVPWDNWNATITADPRYGCTIGEVLDLSPYYDWGAISSFPGLGSPFQGLMGIWCPPHGEGVYFPSDSQATYSNYPKVWLTPGIHPATRYGPARLRLSMCPVNDALVSIPDRNSRPCSLLVSIPPASLIDHSTDDNVIQISPGEAFVIPVGDYAETMAFLASCDGYVEYKDWPDSSQRLGVYMNYDDMTADSVFFDDIHPAGRLDIHDPYWPPSWIFIYGNEVFVCVPAYFEVQQYDNAHSEAWHWYAFHPDPSKILSSVTFIGMQIPGPRNEIYILSLSYSKPPCSDVYIGEREAVPSATFKLSQNSPNPFDHITQIRYALPRDCRVRLEIFNILGQRVAVLADGEQTAGEKAVKWEAASLASGIYFCRLQAGGFAATRKMILLR
jgi:hypothetical protein